MKLLEHEMKVVERVPEKRLHGAVIVDEMQFGFLPERGTIDALVILGRMQDGYCTYGKKVVHMFCGP